MLRAQHTGELTATVVDRIEALDGLYRPLAARLGAGRCRPAAGGAGGAAGRSAGRAGAGSVRAAGAGRDGAAGIGAAAASRSQFLALARLQARFLDRVRGIATIVLYGQAEAEARSLAAAADELRRRTMRVLRVAFLSSAALDLAAALAFVVLALRYGRELLLAGSLAQPGTALFVLLLVPEFFAPLRAFAAAYQDRLHATGAAEALARSAAAAGAAAAARGPHRGGARRRPWRSRTST